jgi:ubiquinone biosynthesis protein Coq4
MNPIEKMVLAGKAGLSFLALVRDPSKLDAVFDILDSLETSEAAERIVNGFARDPRYAEAFEKRPTMGRVDFDSLLRLPEGTLGHTFATEMRARGLDPNDIQMKSDDGTARGYVFHHLRETHDIWHTVTGFDVDVAGELGLQAVYLAQFEAQLALIILALGFLNTAFFAMGDKDRRLDAIARGWQMGRRAEALFGVDWAARYATPLDQVRRELGIEPDARPSSSPLRGSVRGDGASALDVS